MLVDAVAVITSQEQKIKELTEQRDGCELTIHECESDIKRLTEENERLRGENARYEAENHAEFNKWLKLEEATKQHHAELFKEAKIAVKADTVRKFAERLCEGRVSNDPVVIATNVVKKEMLEANNERT
jgi:pyruvate formate-lyase activating enzyme-like uncharacterized protein